MQPLMEQGRMPNLTRLVERGVMGNLATLQPVLSPMLWTSIATGKRPFKHGILGFTEPTPDGEAVQPVSQLSRSTKAIWNILNQCGYRSGVVGWWPSHPVEPINGAMVSNHYHRALGPPERPWPLPPGAVHPPQLAERLAELRFNPNELVPEEVLPFVPLAREVDQDKDRRLGTLMKILAECVSVHNAATWLMQHSEWDFFAVYYDAIDHFSHGFMRYHPPRRDWIPERDYELYSEVVSAAYQFHDMLLGTLLGLVDEDTHVIVCSDHGFHPDHLRPRQIPREPAGPAVEHRDLGMLVMAGPGIRRDELIHGASLLDIAPTLLALFGLPFGEDMDGKPLLQAFETPPEPRRIPSWDQVPGDDGRHAAGQRQDPLAAKAALDQLVALGYVEPPGEQAGRAVARVAGEMRYNLARSYMDADRYPDAIPILRELLEEQPEEVRFGNQLALCYRALGDTPALRRLVERLRETRQLLAQRAAAGIDGLRHSLQQRRAERTARPAAETGQRQPARIPLLTRRERDDWRRWRQQKSAGSYDLDFLMSCVLLDEGQPEQALQWLARAQQARAGRPSLHNQVGETYLKMRRPAQAAQAFRQALAIDPLSTHAHLGLAKALHRLRRHEQAAQEALEAVRLMFHYPMAHFVLGRALLRLHRFEAAARSLTLATELNPNFLQAHRLLTWLYRYWVKDNAAAGRHKAALAQLRQRRQRRNADLEAMREEFAEAPAGEREPARQTLAPPAAVQPGDEPKPMDRVPDAPAADGFVTVVAGLPRSGTSLLMQMLAAGGLELLTDHKRRADTDNPKGYFELELATRLRKDNGWLEQARCKAVKIVAQLLPHIPARLPTRVLFIERDMDEVLASQKAMLERLKRRRRGYSDLAVRGAFERQLLAVKHWMEHNPNVRVHYVRHRDLIENPAAAAQTINQFLGGGLDTTAMARVVDPGLYRQRAVDTA